MRFIRALEVEKLKPAVVRVYDYYAHEDRFEVVSGHRSAGGARLTQLNTLTLAGYFAIIHGTGGGGGTIPLVFDSCVS